MKCSTTLLRCCLAVTLLFSLWASGAQDVFAQDVLESGDIVLNIDADPAVDDASEQLALISDVPLVLFVSEHSVYPRLAARPVLPNCFSPPDRPPARFV